VEKLTKNLFTTKTFLGALYTTPQYYRCKQDSEHPFVGALLFAAGGLVCPAFCGFPRPNAMGIGALSRFMNVSTMRDARTDDKLCRRGERTKF